MKTIDLRNSFEGHVILWAKGHYAENTIEQLVKLQREWSGMSSNWNPFVKDILREVMYAASLIETDLDQVASYIIHSAWANTSKITSYGIELHDKISLGDLILAYADLIRASPIKTEYLEVLLPEPLFMEGK